MGAEHSFPQPGGKIAESLRKCVEQSPNTPTSFEAMCHDLMHKYMTEEERLKIREELLNSKSENDQFARIFPFTKEINMKQSSARTEKSEDMSVIFRMQGNELFVKKKLHEALIHYTQSIALAPHVKDCSALSMAYANRSAALKALGLYEEAICDIKRSLKHNYPQNLHYKALLRQGECYNSLGKFGKATKSFNQAIELVEKATLTEAQKKDILLKLGEALELAKKETKLKNPLVCSRTISPPPPPLSYRVNVELPAASNCVALRYSKSRGRHLLATRDIKPGDVLLVEKPYTAVLQADLKYSHCCYCFMRCHSLLPCSHCSWAMFCSEICQSEATEKFHRLECPAMRSIENLNLKTFMPAHLAVRTLVSTGIDKCLLYHLESMGKPVHEDTKRTQGFNSKGQFVSSEFAAVYHMFSETQYLFNFLVGRILLSICLIKTLKLDNHPQVLQIGGLILKLLKSHGMSAHEIYERFQGPNDKTVRDLCVGNALYPTFGLINHSCDQNVVRNYHGQQCVLRAIATISKGEEILDTYGPHFLCDTKQNRQQHLNINYFFECMCEPCSDDWPNQAKLPWSLSLGNVERKIYLKIQDEVHNALTEYVTEKKIDMENLPILLNYLSVVDKMDGRRCQEYFVIQEIIKVSYASLGNFFQCQLY